MSKRISLSFSLLLIYISSLNFAEAARIHFQTYDGSNFSIDSDDLMKQGAMDPVRGLLTISMENPETVQIEEQITTLFGIPRTIVKEVPRDGKSSRTAFLLNVNGKLFEKYVLDLLRYEKVNFENEADQRNTLKICREFGLLNAEKYICESLGIPTIEQDENFCSVCSKPKLYKNVQELYAHFKKDHSWEFLEGNKNLNYWQMREKLDKMIFSKEEIPLQIKKKIVNQLMPFLKENLMWPLPSGKRTADWIQEVFQNRDLSLRNRVALLKNESMYQQMLIPRSFSEKAKEVKLRRSQLIEDALKTQYHPILASIEAGSSSGNENIISVLKQGNLPDPFWGLGGNKGHIYFVHDPAGLVSDFILSATDYDHSTRSGCKYEKAFKICQDRGASLPTPEQWEAIERAMTENGIHNPNAINDLYLNYWTQEIPSYRGDQKYFRGYRYHRIEISDNIFRAYIRCALPASAW